VWRERMMKEINEALKNIKDAKARIRDLIDPEDYTFYDITDAEITIESIMSYIDLIPAYSKKPILIISEKQYESIRKLQDGHGAYIWSKSVNCPAMIAGRRFVVRGELSKR
jgi:HK97 family phage major capsid protein